MTGYLMYHGNWPSGGTAGLASLWCPFSATTVRAAPEGLSLGLTDDICNFRGQGCLELYSRGQITELHPCTTSTMQTSSSLVTGYWSWWQCLCVGYRSREVPIPALSLPPAQQTLKKPVALSPWHKLFSNTTIICGCFVASWGSIFWSGSASPLPQELLEELTANRFSLPQCGLMSNSAQWELTSWQTRSVNGGCGGGEENVSCTRLQETESNFTDGPEKLL